MKNTLSVKSLPDGRIQTEFNLSDGISAMEIHREKLHDSKVLKEIVERKHYQNIKGEWTITFPDEPYSISKPTFEKLIEAAQLHIFTRDNSTDYSGFM